jgi:hypothetical protein
MGDQWGGNRSVSQTHGLQALGGEVNYLTPGEGAKADAVNFVVLDRI